MIPESVEHGLLIRLIVEENGVTRTKKYAELSVAEKFQADCDMKATNIILQGLAVPVFSLRDDPIACLNKAMAFLIVVASSRVTVQQVQGRQGQIYFDTGYKSNATSSGGNNASGQEKDKAMLAEAHEAGQILDDDQLAFLADPEVPDGQATQTIIPNNDAFQIEDLDIYDSDCDDILNAKAILMTNISNYGLHVISEALILKPILMIWKIKEKANKEHNNESVTAELERYKERVKTFEQRLNIDLSSREKND
nr:hypothetical protein [Tanacetum cinerariifolium]